MPGLLRHSFRRPGSGVARAVGTRTPCLRGSRHASPLASSLVGLVLAIPGLLPACSPSAPEGTRGPDATPVEIPDAEYVGAAACATCHAGIAASFARTGMGRSLYPMSRPDASGYARFPDTLRLPEEQLTYDMFEKDGRFFQKQYMLDSTGNELNVDTREIRYVIGSGNHSRSFVTAHDERHYQMPVCWYPEPELWDLCPGYEIRNEHFRREIDDTCLLCHNGRVIPGDRFSNRFKEPFPHGIGCERCHGPGSLHVERWLGEGAPPAPGTLEGDPTIVNPARLPPHRGIEVCMQCHLGDSGQTERVVHLRARIFDHRPGLPMQDHFSVYVYEEKLPGRFGLTSQADRLVLSRCYTQSRGALQCITCHDPHREVYDVSRERPDHFNNACLTCHARDDCSREAHAAEADCTACHMRRAEPTDQRHTTFLDHWIRRRPEEGVSRERTDFTLVPFFPDHDSHGTSAQRAITLGRAYLNRKIGSPEAALMSWDLPIEMLRRAVETAPGIPEAHFFLGKAELTRGRPSLAEIPLREAIALRPDYVEAIQELGSALFLMGRLDEAHATLIRALVIGPRPADEAAVLNEIARIEMERNRPDRAIEALGAALAIEPLGHEMLANRGLASALMGDHEDAIVWYREALRHYPGHPGIRARLEQALGAVSDR